ncbi:type 1 fimbrial protein [Klebsiella aerogenes]|nr:type 1 fimbrial protein [Klebsiella aerogenes]ELY3087894.1 type 1 fimbrial protein [Klebsiella aerogenes]
MKLNKALLAVSVVMGMSSFAHAADQGHGKVTFHGTIIDAPCSIDANSVDQKIELGSIANVALENGGSSTPTPFQILLKDCSLATAQTVTTTFSGMEGVDGKLGIAGSASGAGIVLTDGDGSKITLGQPNKGQEIPAGASAATLEFAAYVQGDGASVVPGEFTGVTDFTLAYQ